MWLVGFYVLDQKVLEQRQFAEKIVALKFFIFVAFPGVDIFLKCVTLQLVIESLLPIITTSLRRRFCHLSLITVTLLMRSMFSYERTNCRVMNKVNVAPSVWN